MKVFVLIKLGIYVVDNEKIFSDIFLIYFSYIIVVFLLMEWFIVWELNDIVYFEFIIMRDIEI